ncbi:MAG: D-2-hydroxyacid dehydrogenase [Gemmatimonadota bacterium]|nr:D-2-hydroxyacid dehydrogenase [Gemmatimonadota bacterium]
MKRKAVIDLSSDRPVWKIPASAVRSIKKAFGPDWTVKNITAMSSSDGDGGRASDAAINAAKGAEVYFGWGVPAEVVDAAKGTLRWAHTASAGVGSSLTEQLKKSGATFTNSPGIQGDPMADWALAAIAFCIRGLHEAVAAQRERRWSKDVFTSGELSIREFANTRVGIVGLGGVGQKLARRCVSLGMEVAGIRRRPDAPKVPGVAWVGGPKDIGKLARQSDVLVIAAPHTHATDRLVDRSVLERLPKGAYVINLARGAILDEAALLDEMDAGRIAGCVLDVFEKEPLPKRHRFWDHSRVLVMPHASAISDKFWERETDLLVTNIGRFLKGKPLKHTVDFALGY